MQPRTNILRNSIWIYSAVALFCTHVLRAQVSPDRPAQAQSTPSRSSQQQQSSRGPGSAASMLGTENPLIGSIPTGQATSGEIDLTLEDTLARGLKYNFGVTQGDLETRFERAGRLRTLSELLPTLNIRPSVTEQQVNLASFGFSGFPGIPAVVGPFSVYDARAYLSAPLLNFGALKNYRASAESINAAQHSYQDVRDQVTLIVTGLYLQAIAGAARVETARAQVETSQTLFQRATDRKTAGTAPAIDVLRSQVELQAQQQRLIAAEGDFEKQKVSLARAIGLPLGQQFRLVDAIPYAPLPPGIDMAQALAQAYRGRRDYQAAEARVKAAELRKQAALAERLPTAGVDANYGVNGPQINQTHGTFTVQGFVNIPVFQGRRVEAQVLETDTELQRERAQLENMRGRIDSEVRLAFLDLRTSARQVEVARSNVDLARQQMEQSHDRFAAGVTNNLEVVQAQEAVAAANESFISSLYAFNVAKAEIARAQGGAEGAITQYLKRNK